MKYSNNFSTLREGEKIIPVHKRKNGKVEIIHAHPISYYKEDVRMIDWAGNKLVGYFKVVQNCVDRPNLWKSVYRGDELPQKDCTCMVTTELRCGKLAVSTATFIAKLGGFIGAEQPLAFIPLI